MLADALNFIKRVPENISQAVGKVEEAAMETLGLSEKDKGKESRIETKESTKTDEQPTFMEKVGAAATSAKDTIVEKAVAAKDAIVEKASELKESIPTMTEAKESVTDHLPTMTEAKDTIVEKATEAKDAVTQKASDIKESLTEDTKTEKQEKTGGEILEEKMKGSGKHPTPAVIVGGVRHTQASHPHLANPQKHHDAQIHRETHEKKESEEGEDKEVDSKELAKQQKELDLAKQEKKLEKLVKAEAHHTTDSKAIPSTYYPPQPQKESHKFTSKGGMGTFQPPSNGQRQ
jgi:phage-related minor tail protein